MKKINKITIFSSLLISLFTFGLTSCSNNKVMEKTPQIEYKTLPVKSITLNGWGYSLDIKTIDDVSKQERSQKIMGFPDIERKFDFYFEFDNKDKNVKEFINYMNNVQSTKNKMTISLLADIKAYPLKTIFNEETQKWEIDQENVINGYLYAKPYDLITLDENNNLKKNFTFTPNNKLKIILTNIDKNPMKMYMNKNNLDYYYTPENFYKNRLGVNKVLFSNFRVLLTNYVDSKDGTKIEKTFLTDNPNNLVETSEIFGFGKIKNNYPVIENIKFQLHTGYWQDVYDIDEVYYYDPKK